MINAKLLDYVNDKLSQPTVILCCRILIKNHQLYGPDARMTKTEIETEFNKAHEDYGIATFRRDYVLRQCGHDENGITQTDNLFYIRPEFLSGMSNKDYSSVIDIIDSKWISYKSQQNEVIAEIKNLLQSNDFSNQERYIRDMLTTRETVKRGQAFEVTSFSVLFVFLSSFGFSLNRYSTTYSNDGGVDYVGQNAIYQVTTKLSERKFEEDIKKAPGKNRVMVYKDIISGFDYDNLNHELVINHISKEELCEVLQYLAKKNPAKFLPEILNVMINEFLREFYQNEI